MAAASWLVEEFGDEAEEVDLPKPNRSSKSAPSAGTHRRATTAVERKNLRINTILGENLEMSNGVPEHSQPSLGLHGILIEVLSGLSENSRFYKLRCEAGKTVTRPGLFSSRLQ